ncbi:extracellular solute-binding protein [Rhodoluna sp.]|uniref:sugar ABC transporter substrate-binding protein n=1 Tax=Rhodoluna sp. TaxID=1969481 RepID=UPI0025D43CCF|nr:extracellular solute-binding protein [Rhodoluna sp.]
MKIRKSSIAAAVATLAAGAMLAVSTPAIADTPNLLVWVDSARKADFSGPVATWAKANGVTVTLTGKDFGTVRDALKTAVPAGTGPDLLIAAAHDWTGNLAAAGVLRPVTLSAATTSTLASNALQAFLFNGKQYGVPFYTENIALVRNLKKAPKAPTTGAQIKDGQLLVGTYGAVGGDPYHFYPVQSSFGAPVFNSTSKGWTSTLGMDGAEGTKFAQYLATKGQKFFGKADFGWDNAICGIKSGTLAYWITGPWAVSSIEGGNSKCTTKSVINKDYAVSAIPSFGGKTAQQFMGAKGGFITNSPATDVVNATQLLTYLAGKEAGIEYFNVDNFTPANKAALAVASSDPVIAAFAAAGKNAVPMPNIVAMDSVWDKWGKTEAKILTGKSTNPAADWKTMTSAITALIKG